MKESKDLKKLIKQIRKQKGISQKSMAERLNMARSTYSKIESGNTELKHQILVNISKVLDVPLKEIIDDPVSKSISGDLEVMLFQAEYFLSESLVRMIPYDELTAKHKELLREKGFEGREAYENTPRGGRIYKFAPKDVFAFMLENCAMNTLFENNLIHAQYLIDRWNNYHERKKKLPFEEWRSLMSDFNEKGELLVEGSNEIEIDDTDYFLVYIINLKMPGNKELWAQFAMKDFPEEMDEWDALEYCMGKKGALDGDIMTFTMGGYDDSFDEIINYEPF